MRKRDLERRFIQKRGWTAYKAVDPNGGKLWLWMHKRYKCSYLRREAFKKETVK